LKRVSLPVKSPWPSRTDKQKGNREMKLTTSEIFTILDVMEDRQKIPRNESHPFLNVPKTNALIIRLNDEMDIRIKEMNR